MDTAVWAAIIWVICGFVAVILDRLRHGDARNLLRPSSAREAALARIALFQIWGPLALMVMLRRLWSAADRPHPVGAPPAAAPCRRSPFGS